MWLLLRVTFRGGSTVDFWDCFGRKILCLIIEEIRYEKISSLWKQVFLSVRWRLLSFFEDVSAPLSDLCFFSCRAGWKRDWTGKWVRDEDAEFDSDEETPDLL